MRSASVALASLLLVGGCSGQPEHPDHAFCQTAQIFNVRALDEPLNPHAAQKALEQMARLGPPELRSDLLTLAAAKPGSGTEAERKAGARVGDYVETHCEINLPGHTR